MEIRRGVMMKLDLSKKRPKADRRPRKSKAGKGDGSRITNYKRYRENYDKIKWSEKEKEN